MFFVADECRTTVSEAWRFVLQVGTFASIGASISRMERWRDENASHQIHVSRLRVSIGSRLRVRDRAVRPIHRDTKDPKIFRLHF